MQTTDTNPLEAFLASLGMRPFEQNCDCPPGECPAHVEVEAIPFSGHGGIMFVDGLNNDDEDDGDDFDLKAAVTKLGDILEPLAIATSVHAMLLKQIADGEI